MSYYYKIKTSNKVSAACLALFFIVLFIHYMIPSLLKLSLETTYNWFVSILLVFISYPILIKSVHTDSNKSDKMLGEMSYIVYLAHWVWIIPYFMILRSTNSPTLKGVLAFSALFLTFVSSFFIISHTKRNNWLFKLFV